MSEVTQPPREPLFNVPPFTSALVMAVVVTHLFRVIRPFPIEYLWMQRGGFVPVEFLTAPGQHAYTLLTYAFLHASVVHLLVNVFGLLAFSSGLERVLGVRWTAGILVAGIVAGALGHAALFPTSDVGLVGISAGVSALFGALLYLISGPRRVWGATAVFVLTNIALGWGGLPNQPGLEVAWQAHIFGYAAGLVLAAIATFRRRAILKP